MDLSSALTNLWAHIVIDDNKRVQSINKKAIGIISPLSIGMALKKVLPWFREDWLNEDFDSRIVKTSIDEKYLLDIVPDTDNKGWYHILMRHVNEFNDTNHLWCEVAQSIIGVQRFIDSSYDGLVIADGRGTFLAANEAYFYLTGLEKEKVLGKSLQYLESTGLLPQSCALKAMNLNETYSAVVKYPTGKEVLVTSTLLKDDRGNIVRVLSNVRDIYELSCMRETLNSVKALASGYQQELKAIHARRDDIHQSLIRSTSMKELYDLVNKVSATDLQILITGPSGTGKTALAKYIHAQSERNNAGSFIHVNCSAIPETLLESELFGYHEGSFTGAKKLKIGLFELAHKGTIFLDEIGDMPLNLQAKILNVLQEGYFYRVGGTKEIEVDVRIIAATNKQLETLITKGLFRQDLYYRLNVIPIRIPPLSERLEDIPPLIAYYLALYNKKYNANKVISSEAMEVLLQYDWPGNIRELMHLLERMVVIVNENIITTKHLPPELLTHSNKINLTRQKTVNTHLFVPESFDLLENPHGDLRQIVARVEHNIIEQAIEECGSLKEASKRLGVDVTTLIRKRKKSV